MLYVSIVCVCVLWTDTSKIDARVRFSCPFILLSSSSPFDICAVLNEYKEDLSKRKKNSIFLVVCCFFCGSECFTAEGVRAIVEEKRPSRPGKTLIILSLSGEVDGRSTSSMPKGCGHTKHICLYYLFIFYALHGAYMH